VAPGWQGAKVLAYREYAEISQRSQASMHRRLKCEVIFECALRLAVSLGALLFVGYLGKVALWDMPAKIEIRQHFLPNHQC